jgi:hypothetical protein
MHRKRGRRRWRPERDARKYRTADAQQAEFAASKRRKNTPRHGRGYDRGNHGIAAGKANRVTSRDAARCRNKKRDSYDGKNVSEIGAIG